MISRTDPMIMIPKIKGSEKMITFSDPLISCQLKSSGFACFEVNIDKVNLSLREKL